MFNWAAVDVKENIGKQLNTVGPTFKGRGRGITLKVNRHDDLMKQVPKH